MNLKILNLEPPEPRFFLQNQTSNPPNHPKKTKPQTRFVPSLDWIENFLSDQNPAYKSLDQLYLRQV